MPTLAELRQKWFLDFGANAPDGTIPPVRRHPGTQVRNYTDGNIVTPLIDGQAYMRVWYDSLMGMVGLAGAAFYHSGWRLEGVATLGQTQAASDAVEVMKTAHAAGVDVHVLASRHGGGLVSLMNGAALGRMNPQVMKVRWDNRYPVGGSNHHKFACFRKPGDPTVVLGSVDISTTRWDTGAHRVTDPDRVEAMTHDLGVEIRGPAVADVELTFIERWNDSSRDWGMQPGTAGPLIDQPASVVAPLGTHSVQVLRTYGQCRPAFGYSWSPTGEFSVWASYLNAIRKAQKYIYIEDQYFWAPWLGLSQPTGAEWENDLFNLLGQAIQRGVKVIMILPDRSEDFGRQHQLHQRSRASSYLTGVAVTAPGAFALGTLFQGQQPIMVHSKLLIVDDEFVLLGSANVNQRSLTCDGELDVGIVDEAELFARDLRCRLWEEHLGVSISDIQDIDIALDLFIFGIRMRSGRLRPLSPDITMPGPGQERAMKISNPYYGPPR